MDRSTNRRRYLRAVAGLGWVAGAATTAGCVASLSEPSESAGGSSPVEKLPAETDGVAWMDAETVREGEAARRLVNASIAAGHEWWDWPYSEDPGNYEEFLQHFEDPDVLDVGGVDTVIAFGGNRRIRYLATGASDGPPNGESRDQPPGFGGFVVEADWGKEAVFGAIPTGVERTQIGGKDVYEADVDDEEYDTNPFAVLEPHTFAFASNRDIVATVIEAWTGDGDRIDGELAAPFVDGRPAVVRSVWRVPGEWIQERIGGRFDAPWLESVETVTATGYRVESGGRGLEVRLDTDDGEAAGKILDVVEAAPYLAESYGVDDRIREPLADLEPKREGTTAVVTYEASIREWVEFLVALANRASGGDDPREIPSASFDFDQDSEGGSATVTVVHEGGDLFNGANTGELRYGVVGGDLSTWELPVQPGDERVVGNVGGGDTVAVVWESRDGERSRTVADFEAV